MAYFQAVVLGIVQGLTEFLPVSSSAHLILARALLGWDAADLGLPFDVACHVGTLGAVVAYFRADLVELAAAVPGLFRGPIWPADGPARRLRLIAVGTVPVVIAGVLFAGAIEDTLRTPWVTVVTLVVVAVLFLAVERAGRATRGEEAVTPAAALAIGVAQASALIPGVSRSGATITTGMFLGIRREAAARFSFLLGVPAILAAAAYEGLPLLRTGISRDQAWLFVIGMGVSGVVGYVTIKYFLRYLVSHTLVPFAWYRIALAAMTAVWLLSGRS
ncbi:MAG: undecaprenyl-diphosphatase UppP [Vicinamibacterales bacterium]